MPIGVFIKVVPETPGNTIGIAIPNFLQNDSVVITQSGKIYRAKDLKDENLILPGNWKSTGRKVFIDHEFYLAAMIILKARESTITLGKWLNKHKDFKALMKRKKKDRMKVE